MPTAKWFVAHSRSVRSRGKHRSRKPCEQMAPAVTDIAPPHDEAAGLSSLAAGNVAATTSMAKLIGEDVFPAVVHEGERESIYISVIGRSLLVVVFDERSTVSLVKIRSKRASYEVAAILAEIATDSEQQRLDENSFFSEITDDDIDSLFS